MAERSPIIVCEDVPLNQARRMSRGPRMDPELSHVLTEQIESLDNTAIRLTLPEGTHPPTMKHCILRVAAEISIPVTVRNVPGGVLWRSTDEDFQQATEVVPRLQVIRKPPRTTRRSTRRRG
jgi:hypothetical protein